MGRIEHMFEQLREAVDELSVPVDGRALTQLLGVVDQLMAKVASAVGEFDHLAMWELDGATSMRAWLRDAGLTTAEATRLVSTARRVRSLPVVAAAWESGELSGGQVQAIVHNVPERLMARFAEHEAEVVPKLVGLPVHDTVTAMKHWAARADALSDEPEPPERESTFHLSQTMDGVGWPTAPSTPKAAPSSTRPSSSKRATTTTPRSRNAGPKPWPACARTTSTTRTCTWAAATAPMST